MLKPLYLFATLYFCCAFLNAQAPQLPLPGLRNDQPPQVTQIKPESPRQSPLKSPPAPQPPPFTGLTGSEPPQIRLSMAHPPLAILVASSNLRWTQPVVLSSLEPAGLLEILIQSPPRPGHHLAERAINARAISQVDPYVELSPAEMALFFSLEVRQHLHLYEAGQSLKPKPNAVAVVVVVYSPEKIGYKFISSDALMMLQHGWLEVARMEQLPEKRINALSAVLALSRTIQSIAELNRERGFYIGR